MHLRIFTEPQQGADYGTLLRGRQGHRGTRLRRVLPVRPLPEAWARSGLPGPTDAWITLAGLARETSRIRLGTLMSPATFRLPGPAGHHGGAGGPDERRPGRTRAGHRAGSTPSTPRTGSRSRRWPSGSAGWKSSWRSSPGCGRPRQGSTFSFSGSLLHADRVTGAAQAGPAAAPAGPDRRWRAAPDAAAGGQLRRRVQRAVRQRRGQRRPPSGGCGRPARRRAGIPASLVYSVAQTVCCGRDEAELGRRAAAIGRPVDDLRDRGLAGSPAEVVDKLGRFAAAGASAGLPSGARPARPRPPGADRRRGHAPGRLRPARQG